ncbi:NADH-quinone oxidoreductase [Gordonia oryzae]|uniref:NADH-quinone oxidoreductase n=1 Tax=Gordonia oryzae TaxID=2487349 RepID=A0A3N4G7H7_9ACTN|nr:NADH-ubiquinone oxidoreductase-F iron-sulfur binding region domain-containing protein [Gordonia oryzae]RPA57347.1 NADH-quinone oxidoreductase [Gordonia oryzae]
MTDLIDLVARAGLGGRGGAGFSTAIKLRAAHEHRAMVVINACDGELGAAKDGAVIAHHLDEVLAAANRIAADNVLIAAHRGSDTLARVQAAGVEWLEVPNRYVASEESSLAALAAGGHARPLMRFAPITSGARDAAGRSIGPTVVFNAETVWRIEQIVRRGPGWFRSYGTDEEPGPRLVTIGGAVCRPGVYESSAGVSIAHLLDLAGGLAEPSHFLWLNGAGGGLLPVRAARSVRWSRAGLGPHGLGVGPAIVHAVPAHTDIWELVAGVVERAGAESAGQCGPCVFGLPALAEALDRVIGGRATVGDRRLLSRRLALLHRRGACRHPDGVAGFVDSALRVAAHLLPPPVRVATEAGVA